MSLFKQFYLLIFSALLMAFLLSNWFIISSSRTFLESRMENHAQDTATSLGISMGDSIAKNDKAKIDTLLNAIFDNGYFSEIRVEDGNGKLIGHKQLDWHQFVISVPKWFQQLISIPVQNADSEVSYSWKQVGSIDVTTHPGFVYQQLWQTMKRNFWAFIGMMFIYLLLVSIIHKRFAIPLNRLVNQAQNMASNKYSKITEEPHFSEFKILVEASNIMVESTKNYVRKLSDDATHWHQAAFVDPLTKLPNRRDFERHFVEIHHNDEQYHAISVAIIQISGISDINNNKGYQQGDQLLKLVSSSLLLQQKTTPGLFVARLNGPEFVCVIRDLPVLENEVVFNQMERKIRTSLEKDFKECHVNIGAVVMQPGLDIKKYLAAADSMVVSALADSLPLKLSILGDKIISIGKNKQHQLMLDAINNKRIRLKSQKLFQIEDEKLIAMEHFLQLQIPDHGWVAAGRWLSGINESNDKINVDRLVIDRVLKNPDQPCLQMININVDFLFENDNEVDWLIKKYQNQIASVPIALEFNQLFISEITPELVTRIDKLKQADIQIGVDHFGFHADSIQWLTRIKPNYIKLNTAILESLNENLDHLSYIETLINLAHSLGIKVYASGVESDPLITLAMQLKFDGYQGFALENGK